MTCATCTITQQHTPMHDYLADVGVFAARLRICTNKFPIQTFPKVLLRRCG